MGEMLSKPLRLPLAIVALFLHLSQWSKIWSRSRVSRLVREAILLTHQDIEAARGWLGEAEENNWSVSQLRKQIRLDQADKSTTLTIKSLNHATLYQHINSLYSFVRSCDVDEDAPILDKLEEDARSLIKVIGEKRNTRTRELPVGV